MTINVEPSLLIALDSLRLNLSHYYLLLTALQGSFDRSSPIHIQTLERKNYVFNGDLTPEGRILIEQLLQSNLSNQTQPEAKEIKKAIKQIEQQKSDLFTKWWKAFPASTTWYEESGKKWDGGRNLRIKKDQCEQKFNKWLQEGADGNNMIEIIEWEVEKLKKKSVETGENQMQWMPSTERWLNSRNYDDALEAMNIDKQVGTKTVMQDIRETISNQDFL